jgi:hypothetical protein
MKKTTPQEFKEMYASIRKLGKKHKMDEDFIELACKCWKLSVKKIESEEYKDFNFRKFFKNK